MHTGESVRLLHQRGTVLVQQAVVRFAQQHLQQLAAALRVRQRDVDAFHEPAPHGFVLTDMHGKIHAPRMRKYTAQHTADTTTVLGKGVSERNSSHTLSLSKLTITKQHNNRSKQQHSNLTIQHNNLHTSSSGRLVAPTMTTRAV